jgi:adenylate kinase
MIRTIFLVGKPGSGKETQARLIAEKTGFSILSTGEKFRELREHRDALGEHVRKEYDSGNLMPDWFADYLFEEAILNLPNTSGIIFEGSGRSKDQAEIVNTVCAWLQRKYVVFNLDISDDEAVRRMMGRGRPDSNTEEKIRTRLKAFADVTQPALGYYAEQGVLTDISGERSIEAIHEDIMKRLGA